MARSPQEVQQQIEGLLPFMTTPFAADGEVDIPCFREHLGYLLQAFEDRPSCFFVCCGTGEFWSLSLNEYRDLVRAAVAEVGAEVPIVAGVGYGTPLALEFARAATEAGVDALLVFPPYLASGPQEGLYEHYATIAAATPLGIMVYHRDNAVFQPSTVARLVENHPNVIGLKDGYGDLDVLAEIRRLIGDHFLLMNGMPTAEVYAKAIPRRASAPTLPVASSFCPNWPGPWIMLWSAWMNPRSIA